MPHGRRLQRREAHAGIDHGVVHGREHGPVDIAHPDRPALNAVTAEQATARAVVQHQREFPRDVVRILDGGVEPEAGGRRMAMGGVTRKEHASDLIAIGQHRIEHPFADFVHTQFKIGQLEQGPQARHHGLFVEVMRIVSWQAEMDHPLFRMPAPGRTHRHHRATAEHATAVGIDEPGDEAGIVPVGGQIRGDVRGHYATEIAQPFELDAEQRADSLAAVGRDQKLRAHLVAAAAVAVTDRSGDAAVILPQGSQFVIEPDPARPAAFGVSTQQRLEPELRVVTRRARAVRGVDRRDRATAESIDLVKRAGIQRTVAAKGSSPAHLGHVLRWRAYGINRIGNRVLAQHFHRALIQVMRLGQMRGARVPLDHQVIDAEIGQQNRGGQTAATAAHDQYRYCKIGHGSVPVSATSAVYNNGHAAISVAMEHELGPGRAAILALSSAPALATPWARQG